MRTPRFSIAGLMGIVLVTSLGLAALASASEAWAGAMLLLQWAILALAVVGAICRQGPARAWWLGFLLFGWGYQRLAASSAIPLPTDTLLEAIAAYVGAPFLPEPAPGGKFRPHYEPSPFEQIADALWGLLAAALGGLLARAIFGSGPPVTESVEAGVREAGPAEGGGRLRLAAIGAVGAVLILAIAVIGPRSRPGLWAGTVFFLTWGLLGLLALGAAFGRGRRRAMWAGAGLFGTGYILLIFGSGYYEHSTPILILHRLAEDLRGFLPPIARSAASDRSSTIVANERILQALDPVVSLRFPEETPLDDVLEYIRNTAIGPDRRRIPIYVDPPGLTEAEKTLTSSVQIDLEGVPLRTGLTLLLRQLGLTYLVRGGLLEITSETSMSVPYELEDPYVVSAHCLLALIAAVLGGLLAPLVAEPRRRMTICGSEGPGVAAAAEAPPTIQPADGPTSGPQERSSGLVEPPQAPDGPVADQDGLGRVVAERGGFPGA